MLWTDMNHPTSPDLRTQPDPPVLRFPSAAGAAGLMAVPSTIKTRACSALQADVSASAPYPVSLLVHLSLFCFTAAQLRADLCACGIVPCSDLIVILLGVFFTFLTMGLTKIEHILSGQAITSEEFNTAGASRKSHVGLASPVFTRILAHRLVRVRARTSRPSLCLSLLVDSVASNSSKDA